MRPEIMAAIATPTPVGYTWYLAGGLIADAAAAIGGVGALLLWRRNARKLEAETVETQHAARKLDAETAEVLTRSALDMIRPLQDQVSRLTIRVDQLEVERTKQLALLGLHETWDAMVVDRLQQAGIDLPPAPPLHLAA